MDNYFPNISPKISGSQEDNQISIFGCPHSFSGRRGHEDTQILLPCGGSDDLSKVQGTHSNCILKFPVFISA